MPAVRALPSFDNKGLKQINVGAGTSPGDGVNKGQVDALSRTPGVGTLRALRPAVSWGQDSAVSTVQHTAFPSVVQLRNGSLYMVVRRASNHVAARDGGIWYSTSSDSGRSWAAPVQLWAAAGGLEYRDPCVSLSADGTTIYLTYFRASDASPAAGCYFRTSIDGGLTWSAEVRFDGGRPYAACTAPVVELANGRLVAPFYGKDLAGDALDSVYVSISTNGGVSWVPGKIYSGADATTHLQEPWVTRKPNSNELFMTFRWGTNDRIAYGTTAQGDGLGWSPPAIAFSGTGRPSTVWLSTGEVVATYRNSTNEMMYVRMYSEGAWSWPTLVRRSPSGGYWTYAQPIELGSGTVLCPLAVESAGATPSKLYLTALARGGGWSPIGHLPPDAVAVATGYDFIEYATTFKERAATTLAPEWTVLSGALTIAGDGYLASSVPDGIPDRAMVDVNKANVTLDADFFMTVQSGAAILFRIVDASNFLMWTAESAGTVMRLYKVVGGAATQLTSGNANMALSSWNTLSIEATDTVIRGYVNGTAVTGYLLAAGTEASVFTTPGRHGVGLNAPTGGVHYCRRFLVRGL